MNICKCSFFVYGNEGKSKCMKGRKIVVYFPGDIQCLLKDVRKNGGYSNTQSKYSFENTKEILTKKFPQAASIAIIKPTMQDSNFCNLFDEFLDNTDSSGCPIHPNRRATTLQELNSVFLCLSEGDDTTRFIVVGFSKGGNILNQIIEEVFWHPKYINEPVFNNLDAIHWVDSGNSGYHHYPVKEEVIVNFSKKVLLKHERLRCFFHVTPFTLGRPNVSDEVHNLTDLLKTSKHKNKMKNLSSRVKYYEYYTESGRSMTNHFLCLENFKTN